MEQVTTTNPEAYLAQVADRRREQLATGVLHSHPDVAARPDTEMEWYRLLARSAECLIDCAGQTMPDYRAKLIDMAALALAAVADFDAKGGEA